MSDTEAKEQVPAPPPPEAKETYEGSPEELTAFEKPGGGGPAWFDRRKVLITLCIAFSAVVTLGVMFNIKKDAAKEAEEDPAGRAARTPRDFLRGEYDRSLRRRSDEDAAAEGLPGEEQDPVGELSGLPDAVPVDRDPAAPPRSDTPPPPPGGGGAPFSAPFSALVPSVEGSLFPETLPPPLPQNPQYPPGYDPASGGVYGLPSSLRPQEDSYAAQNNQAGKQAFYGSASGGSLSGAFLPDDILWIGTMVPAVLETSVNTDLPGNVIARVTENVYDSRTGHKLLIPQGSILVARYNSSISYAQKRVQIVWDLLIRPDGYQLELEGMNGVDRRGMAGLPAEYRENWFEYVKAAGIITMFSIANSRMAEESAKYGSADAAAGVTASNAEFINQIGGNIVSRAMDIQPTLILHSGEKVFVMLNKNVYLPPVENHPVKGRYILK